MSISRAVKIEKFSLAFAKFILKGRGKFVTREVIDKRFSICKDCEQFTGCSCKICGCTCGDKYKLMNKLAYPTECCPDNPSKWEATIK